MNYNIKIFYNGIYGMSTKSTKASGRNIQEVEFAVLTELNKKNFISIEDGVIIPTSSIKLVDVSEIKESEEKTGA